MNRRAPVGALLRAGFSTSLVAGFVAAQIPLGGALSGTLAAGVYHTTGSLSVAAGQTSTLAPGVIIKFTNGGHQFTVDGTLIANGTAQSPVILTDVQDDSAGGDTNGNGPSVGSPTAWRGLVFNGSGSSASALHYLDARYGGSGFVSNFYLIGASPTLDHCTSRNNYTHGMNLNGSSFPTVTSCVFTNNGGYAIENTPIAALTGFAGNTASGNAGNYARVVSGAVAGNLTLTPAMMIGGAFVFDTSMTVPPGATLTFAAGTVCKFANGGDQLTVDGTLLVDGTAAAPVVFTGIADDSAAGDTNGNGPSTAAPTAWRGIVFTATSTRCVLRHADARYGGSGFVSNFHLIDASPTLIHCTSRDNFTHGMNLNGNSFPTMTDCAFVGNGGLAIENVPIAALTKFADNTALRNAGNTGNYARVVSGSVTGNLTLTPAMMIGGVFVFDTLVTVAQGATLAFGAGTVCKFANGGDQLTVDGTLRVDGTAAAPVVFTGLADDSAGGDTNGNGPSTAAPTAWRGIVFTATSTGCVLRHADARYGGGGFVSNFHLIDASPTLDHCTSRDNYTHGLFLTGSSAPTVRDCTFTNNGGYAVEGVRLAAVPGFADNHASGNVGNFLRVTDGNVNGPLTIGPQSCLEGALVVAANVAVQPGADLTLQQGVVLKFQVPILFDVYGAIHVRGSGYEPVVLTEFRDDDVAGDTNGNGPSSGQPGAWYGLFLRAGAAASRVEHAVIRFPGTGFVAGLTSLSPAAQVHAVRVDHAYANGFVLDRVAGNATDLVAWANGGHGIQLTGGAFQVAHATCAGNVVGIRREVAWTGEIVNSISYGNTANFDNFPNAAQVRNCDGGFAGVNGNLLADPRFVDAGNGDLHLLPTSPCLGIADLPTSYLTVEDFDQNSRLLDHALAGSPIGDLGAYELGVWGMTVAGEQRPGAVLDYTVTGPAGLSFYLFGTLDGVLQVPPYGLFVAGASAAVISGPVPTGTTFPLPVPAIPGLVGVQAGIQTLSIVGSFAVGNLTRMHRILLRP